MSNTTKLWSMIAAIVVLSAIVVLWALVSTSTPEFRPKVIHVPKTSVTTESARAITTNADWAALYASTTMPAPPVDFTKYFIVYFESPKAVTVLETFDGVILLEDRTTGTGPTCSAFLIDRQYWGAVQISVTLPSPPSGMTMAVSPTRTWSLMP